MKVCTAGREGEVAASGMTSDSTNSSDTYHDENLTVRSSPYFYRCRIRFNYETDDSRAG